MASSLTASKKIIKQKYKGAFDFSTSQFLSAWFIILSLLPEFILMQSVVTRAAKLFSLNRGLLLNPAYCHRQQMIKTAEIISVPFNCTSCTAQVRETQSINSLSKLSLVTELQQVFFLHRNTRLGFEALQVLATSLATLLQWLDSLPGKKSLF